MWSNWDFDRFPHSLHLQISLAGSQWIWMWSQCKISTPSWQRSSLWWANIILPDSSCESFLNPQEDSFLNLHPMQYNDNRHLHSAGLRANNLWETLSETDLLPRPHREFDMFFYLNLCYWDNFHSLAIASDIFFSFSSSTRSTSTAVSMTSPSLNLKPTLSSLVLAHLAPFEPS